MKAIKKYIYTMACLLGLVSCDSFLTTPPLLEISEEMWWKDKSQAEMMVRGTYDYLPGLNEIAYWDCISDNAIHREDKFKQIGNGTHTTQTGLIKDQWKYDKIAKLNYVLEGLEKAREGLSEAEYLRYTSEVRFIRAFTYYNMLFYFGDIPLIKNTLTVSESRETSRQPRAEVLSFVLDELENYVLPNINTLEIKESGRVNEQVVNAFLSRIYLFEKNYEKVLEYTDKVIKSGDYELYADYDELFRPQSDGNNKEVIFERQYSAPLVVHDLNRNLSYTTSVYKGWTHVGCLQNLIDEYECQNGHLVSECEKTGCEFHQKRIDAETDTHRGEYDFRDPRMGATVIWPFKEWVVDGNVRSRYGADDPVSGDNAQKAAHATGFLCQKWIDMRGENADRVLADKNMPILRYGDVLLMRAEALIELNQNLPEAVSWINQIRTRVNMPAIKVASQSVLREKLRHERRIETAFEGLRYFDIIRWKIGDQVRKGKVYGARLKVVSENMDNKYMEERFWEDKMYLFPVPQEAVDNNPNLLPQNKGWE
ncbi:RagB/SusD family nutrient uptake outer membrane protein [uncultured Parabacteroides sp.]|uniref:RagB/SusD family nutrient uptake outer membrane protein n=3 Tax=uncultured Parabacteroides sp. TaxID=512312 RepID=UPI0025D118B6|nr:RagB/SusD family nutrient uptake outer membrane protein [uncultured Parabacteroides sp.]